MRSRAHLGQVGQVGQVGQLGQLGTESGGGLAAPPPPRTRRRRARLVLDGWPPFVPGDGGDGDGGGGDGDDGARDPWDGLPRPGTSELALTLALVCIGVLFLVFCAIALVVVKTSAQWPPPGSPAPPHGLLASTLLLLGCSVALTRGLGALRAGARAVAERATWTAGALGLAFLGVQSLLWNDLYRGDVPASNGYVAFFYLLTGLHAAHVAGGLVFLGRTLRRLRRRPSVAVLRMTAVYWHAMGVIWIGVFAILYLVH
jgi:heme/copper-type cytochrome/quinol oxidase subunit 3